MTEEERAELTEIIVEVLKGNYPLAEAIVERLVETKHFYYLPIKLRSES